MTDLSSGSLVKHVSLGIGKVVAVEPTAVHVFFPRSETRSAAKLRWPAASSLLTRDGVEPDAWLSGLTSFELDPATGRYALAANFLSHGEAIAAFQAAHPGGFGDPHASAGKRERASRWRAAAVEWTQALGGGEGERLLAAGDQAELTRRALKVGALVAMLPGAVDLDDLAEALAPAEGAAKLFAALFGVLAAPSGTAPRLDELFHAAAALRGPPERAWPLATMFPFLADPSRHAVLLPRSACAAAARLGCDLRYDPAPSPATYAVFLGFAAQLLEELRPHGARDFVDVETFMHALGSPVRKKR